MTRSETGDMLATLCIYYPNNKLEVNEITINAWWAILHDREYGEIIKAVKAFVSNDDRGFFPAPGQILNQLAKLKSPANGMSETEAWRLVERACSNGIYGYKEEFEKLPPIIQRIVGDSRQLFDWSILPSDELKTVVASNFMRSYRARIQYEREYEMLPNDVKKFAQTFSAPELQKPLTPYEIEQRKREVAMLVLEDAREEDNA